jgi:hypothetical protein
LYSSWTDAGAEYWDSTEHRIVKTSKHPDNCKPKLKLIDFAKMPKGTMTNFGEVLIASPTGLVTLVDAPAFIGAGTRTLSSEVLRLVEQTNFTYWTGGACPVPEGVVVTIVFRSGREVTAYAASVLWELNVAQSGLLNILAYRVVGLAEGYTDNPAMAASEK